MGYEVAIGVSTAGISDQEVEIEAIWSLYHPHMILGADPLHQIVLRYMAMSCLVIRWAKKSLSE